MTHQEAIARIGRRAGVDRPRNAIERSQRQAVAAVRHVEQQAMIAAPRIFRGQDPDIRGEMDETVAALWGQVDIGDATIQKMSRIDGEMRRAVDLGITPDVTKIPPAGERLTSFDLKGDNSHRVPPSVRSGNAAPGPEGESNRLGREIGTCRRD
jgi:hypothetical protein